MLTLFVAFTEVTCSGQTILSKGKHQQLELLLYSHTVYVVSNIIHCMYIYFRNQSRFMPLDAVTLVILLTVAPKLRIPLKVSIVNNLKIINLSSGIA